MTPAVRRLLLRVFKWVIVPVLFLLVGYLWFGPYVLPHLAGSFLPSAGSEEPLPGAPAEQAKEK